LPRNRSDLSPQLALSARITNGEGSIVRRKD
jgi:hypothetical protein